MPISNPLPLRVFRGLSNRNAGGAQAITGVGFKPRAIIFTAMGVGGTHQIKSDGFTDGSNGYNDHLRGDSVDGDNSVDLMMIRKDATNHIAAALTSMDADGFTLAWSLTGTMTAYFGYLCLR